MLRLEDDSDALDFRPEVAGSFALSNRAIGGRQDQRVHTAIHSPVGCVKSSKRTATSGGTGGGFELPVSLSATARWR